MKKIIYIIFGILLIGSYSCQKDLLRHEEVKDGAFVWFTDDIDAVLGINSISDLIVRGELNANENVASFELQVFGNLASLVSAGNPTGATDTSAIESAFTSFPSNMEITVTEIVAALDSITDMSDIDFGDSFTFIGKLTDVNGIEYFAEAPEILYTEDDILTTPDETDTTFIANGLTDVKLFDRNNGYKDAFDFGFTIGCPANSFDVNSVIGTWNEDANRFKDILGEPYGTIEIIAGPGANQITFVNGDIPSAGSEDFIIEIDPETNEISYAGSADAIHAFGVVYGSAEGTMFGCAGKINLVIHSPGFIDNFWILSKAD